LYFLFQKLLDVKLASSTKRETQEISLLLLTCNHISLLNKNDTSILFNNQCFGGKEFASFFFSKYFAIDKNNSFNSSFQLSNRLFCVAILRLFDFKLDHRRVVYWLHIFNLGN